MPTQTAKKAAAVKQAVKKMPAPQPRSTEVLPLLFSSADLEPPNGARFWLDDSMFERDKEGLEVPRFSVQEASKCFFGQGSDWLRWRMRADKPDKKTGQPKHPQGWFLLDGEPLEFKRLPDEDPNRTTARYYTLADIEKMAHALAETRAIDGTRLALIILMVKACAQLYGARLPVAGDA